jgi:anti-sigma B factor antagonist
MQVKMNTRTVDGVTVLECTGRIVFGDESAALRETVKKLLENSKQIVLNLGGVTYIDSGGLGTLVALYTTARNSGRDIKLAKLTPRVGDLLQVTKLLTVFDVFETEDQAVKAFRTAAVA